ncbi:transcription-repair coupling factor [Thermodesulforhabdus norvegica]|uniref:Transcription-repair-coupling factor n=1 Tax=Thermodesulforhabdus norvegica TaxID=39841 RepID=A0A1I4RIJ5_9BACT|nr:transcription-repair coupling factor [Thermodesulforhabdus norvegica]SFM51866.1 transcription-repair coupling factor [Thermodesulforhabdus norvegica]
MPHLTEATESFSPGNSASRSANLETLWRTLSSLKGQVSLHGLNLSALGYVSVRLLSLAKAHIVLVVPEEKEQELLTEGVEFFLQNRNAKREEAAFSERLLVFPPKFAYRGVWSGQAHDAAQRMKTLTRLLWNNTPGIFVVPARSLLEKTLPREVLEESLMHIRVGEELPADFEQVVYSWGYVRVNLVEEPGDWSRRGDLYDLYTPLYTWPIRIEVWGNQVESIRFFHPSSQRSLGKADDVFIVPCREIIVDEEARERASRILMEDVEAGLVEASALPYWLKRINDGSWKDNERMIGTCYESLGILSDYFPVNSIWIWWDADRTESVLREYYDQQLSELLGSGDGKRREQEWRQPVDRWLESPEAIYRSLKSFRHIWCDDLRYSDESERPVIRVDVRGMEFLKESLRAVRPGERLLEPLVRSLTAWKESHVRAVIVCGHKHRAERLKQLLSEYDLPVDLLDGPAAWESLPPGSLFITTGRLSRGFEWPAEYMAVLSEEELFGRGRRSRRGGSGVKGIALSSFQDLSEGDYVVHVDHGIGRYRGLVRLKSEGFEGDFLLIEYMDEDKLYVPVEKLHKVQKYVGVDDAPPRIDRLGGKHWETAKKKARESAEKIAEELLRIYALRQVKEGYAFSPPDRLYHEFEALFPFEETPDQLKAIEDVLADMMSPRPADRLICGDVGFGKTEVALRAAFKAVMDGKQVAVLVPTTVLAEQHFRTFSERFAPFPVTVELLSRFRTPAQQKKVIEGLKKGTVDIVIGTHRLLQRDVAFRDLGLLIIDEEHRFGVKHKERLKELRVSVDVITLTATPIPRTLHMALSGIRDLSVIETPPEDRKAVKTFLIDFDEAVIRDAIRKELSRGGQVFFVHNHVQNIQQMAEFIRKLVPEARVGVAHGQMKERELEKAMMAFVRGETDVLVCTTIIESGLDIPRANTIIINRADRFGLAQMYQLRGRVGRSDEQAYAYLIIPGEHLITKDARKRLRALLDFSDLGSGFKIAMNDLQIRGGGTILGSAQSGHIAAVGYELYLELVQEMIRRLKGDSPEEVPEPEIKVAASAFLPDEYIPDTSQRLVAYKKLASASTEEDINELVKEWRDRFGTLPTQAKNLIMLAKIRLLMKELGILRIEETGERFRICFVKKDEEGKFSSWASDKGISVHKHPEGGLLISVPHEKMLYRLAFLKRTLHSFWERDRSEKKSLKA